MPTIKVDPRIAALCARVTKKRPKTVIDHILKHGHITTEDLKDTYGYDHPPRAARDVREEGVPLETFKIESTRSGRKIAAYRFANPSQIKHGRIGGRKAFPKSLKLALIERYGDRDALTAQRVPASYLQIDHRVPYEVVGDSVHDTTNLNAYMLLDAASQRAKSWACEHCRNWQELHDPRICESCYWAFPESHKHAAMREIRRLDLQWDADEVQDFERLATEAVHKGIALQTLVKGRLKG